jgi:thiol-disulfide isomerase/thioredoxin
MSLRSRSIPLGFVVVAFVPTLCGFFPGFSTAAQSRKARTTHLASALKPATRPINAEELQRLLRRDGTRPLLVNYWATWCDPCRDEFPDLVKIDRQYRPKGLDFIAITLDDIKDINTEVPKFLRTMRATMPVYLLNVADPEPAINAVDREWGGALPATFLYDPKGEVVYKHFGRVNADELRAAIEKLVSRGQKSEVRSQKSEIRGQKSEVTGQKSVVRCWDLFL